MRVEALEPDRVDQDDFLRRFLDHSGPGPHHLTYKVPSLRAALDEVVAHGYRPVSVDESNPHWKEAFIHPKDGPGLLVQLAESTDDGSASLHLSQPAAWPEARAAQYSLVHVAHAVADMDEGRRFFVGLLAGETLRSGSESDHDWVDVAWPGPGRVHLMSPTRPGAVNSWLEGRSGRVHHLALAGRDPAGIPDAESVAGEGHWVVQPEHNYGTKLVLASAS
jgi:catechol 2,3-dioxygenase-like lactoylglutathione lyase family enzyme